MTSGSINSTANSGAEIDDTSKMAVPSPTLENTRDSSVEVWPKAVMSKVTASTVQSNVTWIPSPLTASSAKPKIEPITSRVSWVVPMAEGVKLIDRSIVSFAAISVG